MLPRLLVYKTNHSKMPGKDSHGAHRRDIEAEETTANDGDGRDEVDVTNSHGCLRSSL